ncbi:GNAT family N-acetyltransferase [Methylomagnum sp.]
MTEAARPTYQLLIELAEPARVQVGRLGAFDFPAGRYVYTGSAKRHPEARLARHLSATKRLHWHIDYLLAAPGARVAGTLRFEAAECRVNQRTDGRVLVPGFGATDCRAGCGSHLKFLSAVDSPWGATPAAPHDVEAIAAMALDISRRCYLPQVLTETEVEVFWRLAYRPEALRADMARGAVYEWIEAGGRAIGFLAYRVESDGPRLRLGKLYVLPEYQGRGVGAWALARVKAIAGALGVREIYLYVFRRNERAVRAYRRAGFVIARAEVTECEGGFRYDDYVMSYALDP